MSPKKHPKDDTDEIMAAILSGKRPAPNQTEPSATVHTKQPSTNQPHGRRTAPADHSPRAKKRSKIKLRKIMLVLLAVAALGGAGYGIYSQQDRLQDLLAPESPFTEQVSAGIDFDLYYPTRLPEGFKLEMDSIGKLEDDVVIYRISNDDGQIATFSQQPVNSKVDYENIFNPETDIQNFELSNGRALIGVGEDGTMVGHLLIDGTWVIADTHTAVISRENLLELFKSMRIG